MPKGAVLAPMAGITDHVMRLLSKRQGCAWTVTEMISAQGFCCAPENKAAIERLLFRTEDEGIVGVQLFGRDPRWFAEAAKAMEQRGFAFIDLNMGCPARKVASGGSGSGLLREPALCGRIVEAVRKSVSVPVTVKMRTGIDREHINALEVAHILEESGAQAIAVHGRTKEDMYMGKADRAVIKAVREAVKIPVIANGDIRTLADARSMIEETGCDTVMIGRGACGNPWLFRDIAEDMLHVVTPEQRIAGGIEHLRMLCDMLGEEHGVIEARKHLAWYLHGLRGAAVVRTHIMTVKTQTDAEDILNGFLQSTKESAGN